MPKHIKTVEDKKQEESFVVSIIEAMGTDTIAKRKACAVLLRQRGVSYSKIGIALGVSDVCAYHYAEPGRLNDYNRQTQLKTTVDGQVVIFTGLNKRSFTHFCELCGGHIKVKFCYHHWLDDFPELGMWLCFKCHQLAETLDNLSDLIPKYLQLKRELTIAYFNTIEQEENTLQSNSPEEFMSGGQNTEQQSTCSGTSK